MAWSAITKRCLCGFKLPVRSRYLTQYYSTVVALTDRHD